MVHPSLKVARRSLYDEGWLKSAIGHSRNRLSAEIIDQTQRMLTARSDEDVRTARILRLSQLSAASICSALQPSRSSIRPSC